MPSPLPVPGSPSHVMPPPRRSCQVEATGPPEAWWRLFSSGLRFRPAPSGTGSLPGWFHAPLVSTLGPGTAGRLLRGDALALGRCQARRASAEEPGGRREHSVLAARGWGAWPRVLTSRPELSRVALWSLQSEASCLSFHPPSPICPRVRVCGALM